MGRKPKTYKYYIYSNHVYRVSLHGGWEVFNGIQSRPPVWRWRIAYKVNVVDELVINPVESANAVVLKMAQEFWSKTPNIKEFYSAPIDSHSFEESDG